MMMVGVSNEINPLNSPFSKGETLAPLLEKEGLGEI